MHIEDAEQQHDIRQLLRLEAEHGEVVVGAELLVHGRKT